MSQRGRPRHDDILTPAEWRVAEGVRHGLTNPAVARACGISSDAVKFHVANILAKLALADRKALRRWDGVRRGAAVKKGEGVMSDLQLSAIGQVSRTVSDIAAARTWYGEVLGLPHLYSFGDLAFFDCAGTRLFLSQGESGVAESILYFRVADIHATQAVLAERGVDFTHAPHMVHRHQDGTEEWMAFFADPDGRPLALMAQAKATG